MANIQFINCSVPLERELKKIHLTVRQKAFADLVALGWKDKDAYQAVGLFEITKAPSQNWKELRKLLQNPDYQAYHTKFPKNEKVIENNAEEAETEEEDITEDDINDLLSKERQLKDLAKKLKYEDLDVKTEMDVRKMIADIQNFKKEQKVEEDKKRVYYIPLKCHRCSLWKDAHSQQ